MIDLNDWGKHPRLGLKSFALYAHSLFTEEILSEFQRAIFRDRKHSSMINKPFSVALNNCEYMIFLGNAD